MIAALALYALLCFILLDVRDPVIALCWQHGDRVMLAVWRSDDDIVEPQAAIPLATRGIAACLLSLMRSSLSLCSCSPIEESMREHEIAACGLKFACFRGDLALSLM